jgi:hypothetical protein
MGAPRRKPSDANLLPTNSRISEAVSVTEPVPLLTVGDLKSELSRWSDDTPVTFRSPLKEQDYRFCRYRAGDNVLVLEINEFPETSPAALPGS